MPKVTIHIGQRNQLAPGHSAGGAPGPPGQSGAGDQLECPWPALHPTRAHHIHKAVLIRPTDPQVVGAMTVAGVARVGGQRGPIKAARGRELSKDSVGSRRYWRTPRAPSEAATRPGGQASCRKVTDSQSQWRGPS